MTTPGIELLKGFVLRLDDLPNGDVECHLAWRKNEIYGSQPKHQLSFTIPKDRRCYVANALVETDQAPNLRE